MIRARYLRVLMLVLIGAGLLGWVVMALWNAVIPDLFVGARTIDYRHALGLLVLSRVLFGGFRGRGGLHGGGRWRRWKAMTAEERAEFQRLGRCSRGT
jgi:hypothetical protein